MPEQPTPVERPDWDLSTVEISNPLLTVKDISPVPCPDDYSCAECRERGFIPRVFAEDCPHCYGDDPYGQPVFCAECEFCCGC